MGAQIFTTRTRRGREGEEDSWETSLSAEEGYYRQPSIFRAYPRPGSQISASDSPHQQNLFFRSGDHVTRAICRTVSSAHFPDPHDSQSASRPRCHRVAAPQKEPIRKAPSLRSVEVPIRRTVSPPNLDGGLNYAGCEFPLRQASEEDEEEEVTQLTFPPRPLRRCKGSSELHRELLARLVEKRPKAPGAAAASSFYAGSPTAGKSTLCGLFPRRRPSDADVQERLKELERGAWHSGSRSSRAAKKKTKSTSRSTSPVHGACYGDVNEQPPVNRRFSLCQRVRRLHPSHSEAGASNKESGVLRLRAPSPVSATEVVLGSAPRSPTRRNPSFDHRSCQPLQQQPRVGHQVIGETSSGLTSFAHTSTIVLVSAADFDAVRANLSQPAGTITLPAITLAPNGLVGSVTDQSLMESSLETPRRPTPLRFRSLSQQQRRENRALPDVLGLLDLETDTAGLVHSEYLSAMDRIR